MGSELTSEARRILEELVKQLPAVVPGRPQTYTYYKAVHDALRLDKQGHTYGESLQRQGLETLARWCIQNNLPAITGLVIDATTFGPGDGYFRVHSKKTEDFGWWTAQVAESKAYAWSKYLESATIDSEVPNISTSSSEKLRIADASPHLGLDAEFKEYLSGFLSPNSSYFTTWLPRYEETISKVRDSLESESLDVALELLWKTQDNSVAHAGQGVIAYEDVDRIANELKAQIREIWLESSPKTFARLSTVLYQWKEQGRLKKMPSLLLARAFATIAPDRYHTTVDSIKHDQVISWVEQHSSFRAPASENWAEKAEALTEFLGRIEGLTDLPLTRNMFPWFVYEQITRGVDGRPLFVPGYRERPAEAISIVAAEVRRIQLRHNVLTKSLVQQLEAEYGVGNVGADQRSGSGGWIDVVLKLPGDEVWLYEIKVTSTASLALREALGQLLEYGYRGSAWKPTRLFVVAEAELDGDSEKYVMNLRQRFGLPIEYLQLKAG